MMILVSTLAPERRPTTNSHRQPFHIQALVLALHRLCLEEAHNQPGQLVQPRSIVAGRPRAALSSGLFTPCDSRSINQRADVSTQSAERRDIGGCCDCPVRVNPGGGVSDTAFHPAISFRLKKLLHMFEVAPVKTCNRPTNQSTHQIINHRPLRTIPPHSPRPPTFLEKVLSFVRSFGSPSIHMNQQRSATYGPFSPLCCSEISPTGLVMVTFSQPMPSLLGPIGRYFSRESTINYPHHGRRLD
jgi:hypothetical protein